MRLGVLAAMALAACNSPNASETIAGEIDDAEIRIATDQPPGALWLELENVGTAPCQLYGLLTDHAGDALPVVDGTVALGEIVEDTYFMGIQVDGSPVPGQGVNLRPGKVARLAIAGPATAERVVLCNGQGDYEAGRFAVLGPRG